ncbi:MAG: hypothetical protein ACP6KW_12525, partial [Candidatus Thorarchaeota archaeon]
MQNSIWLASMRYTSSRGVVEIADEPPQIRSQHQTLDQHRVSEIVAEVFRRRGLPPPPTVEFILRDIDSSRPRVYLENDVLYVIAFNESEVRRLVGRFVVERSWSPHAWLLANRVGLYLVLSILLVVTLPAISIAFAFVLSDLRFCIVAVTALGVSVFSLWAAYQVSMRSVGLLQKLAEEMVDLECLTEFDDRDYVPRWILIRYGGVILVTTGALVLIVLDGYFCQDMGGFLLPSALLLVLISVLFLCVSSWNAIRSNPCGNHHRFKDSEYLQTALAGIIERMDLWDSLTAKYKSDFTEIRARFSKARFPHCRTFRDHVVRSTLFLDAHDLSEEAAMRLGTAVLSANLLRYFRELSFARRTIEWLALTFGALMLIPVLLAGLVSNV